MEYQITRVSKLNVETLQVNYLLAMALNVTTRFFALQKSNSTIMIANNM